MYKYKIKEITKVYDGDTITVILDLGFGITKKQIIRLYGINTPELRGEERPQGLEAKQALLDLIEKYPDFYIQTIKDRTGKYGRMLGILRIPDTDLSINQILVETGFAVEYMK